MDNLITSAGSSTVKRLRKLASSSKVRRQESQAIAEGTHLVASLLDSDIDIKLYFCAQSALANPEVKALDSRLRGKSISWVILDDRLFESITQVHASVGIGAVFATPQTAATETKLETSAILLDRVQDPGNLGTILRSSAAFGIKQIYLSSGCASPWSSKALRSGMGAQFSLEIGEGVDLAKLIQTSTVPVLATSLDPDSHSIFDVNLSSPAAWLFGSEGSGAEAELIALAAKRVYIPQAASSIESLNVAAATAVCLYEQYRQSRH